MGIFGNSHKSDPVDDDTNYQEEQTTSAMPVVEPPHHNIDGVIAPPGGIPAPQPASPVMTAPSDPVAVDDPVGDYIMTEPDNVPAPAQPEEEKSPAFDANVGAPVIDAEPVAEPAQASENQDTTPEEPTLETAPDTAPEPEPEAPVEEPEAILPEATEAILPETPEETDISEPVSDTPPTDISTDDSTTLNTQDTASDLAEIRQQAIEQLTPILDHLDQTPEDKFNTVMMMLHDTGDKALVAQAYKAAQGITNEKAKAVALFDIVHKIKEFEAEAE